MSASWLLFVRLILRPLAREPIRAALTVFAVALGVAVVIAIDLAGQAAAGSFHSSLESLTGKSDLLITANGGLDEGILGKLAALPYPFEFTPRIEDFATLVVSATAPDRHRVSGEALPFLGLDLIGHRPSALAPQDASDATRQILSLSNPVWVGARLNLQVGAQVRLLINDAIREFTVAGILESHPGEIGEQNAIVADIGLAQQATGKTGKLDSIDVQVPSAGALESWRTLLARSLPVSVTVAPQGARTDENRKMLAAFRWNLHVLSYIALMVGAFLIYNTISISVVRRRNEIGVLRALGATRGFITRGCLAEALFFAVSGSMLGLFLGRLMAIGAVRLIGNTVQALYVSSEPAAIRLTVASAAAGVGLGLFVSLLAAFAPALEAARIPPVEAMARGREEYLVERRSRRSLRWIVPLLLASAVLSQLPPVYRQPMFGYVSVLLLIAGTAAAIPGLVLLFAARTGRAAARLLGVEGLLALRSLGASLGRTSVLTAALATAVAMTASVGIMVGSFRETVRLWMDSQLKADFYLRPAGPAAADRHPTLRPEIADQIERLPGVASVDRFRAYPISYQGLPATLAGGETSRSRNAASTRFLPGENRDRILAMLPTGDYAVVSEPFANKHHVDVGSRLDLAISGAIHSFTVLGIYYDYSTERGFIILDRRTLLKYLPDPAASNLAVYLREGTNAPIVRRAIAGITAGKGVLVFANSTLRRGAIEIFDRTFRITYALEAVAIAVAVMGIAGALLAMVIDRRREFALLRFLGAAQPQVRRIILCEAGLLGLLANGIGIVLGTLLSLILIFVINKQSFGWTIQFHWPAAALLAGLSGVYLATVIAALYPAHTALRLNPIEVIHAE
jgi:putative ABC transport system permease protein